MALDWFHRRGFEHRRRGNYSDRRPHKRKGPRRQPTSSVSCWAEGIFEEGCDTHGGCCCAGGELALQPRCAVCGDDRQHLKIIEWLAARAEPNPSEVGE